MRARPQVTPGAMLAASERPVRVDAWAKAATAALEALTDAAEMVTRSPSAVTISITADCVVRTAMPAARASARAGGGGGGA
jgi:hypothetical protein